jgi:hypothetical protein
MSYKQQMLDLYDEFCEATGKRTATTREMARWAIVNDKWQRHEEAALNQCAQDFAEALREHFEEDPSGRRVRMNHAARVNQKGKLVTLWGDMRKAAHSFIETAFRQRRNQIIGDCYQLKQDVDSYNEFYNKGVAIQLPLDFGPDVAEQEHIAKSKKQAA